MKIALAQVSSDGDWRANLARIESLTQKAARQGACAVLFPENVLYRGNFRGLRSAAREMAGGHVLSTVRMLARDHRIAILIGGYPELRSGSQKVFNTAVWIEERGRILARYRKIHLFDVITPEGKKYRESDFFLAGRKPVVFRWRGIQIGMTVCYDLRFPELFRTLAKKGAEWIVVPSAFTRETGRAHWHTLLRARGIENLAVILAPAQTGRDAMGREAFGHSAVFGPWGDPLGYLGRKEGLLVVHVDAHEIRRLRRRFPVLKD